MPLGGLGAVHGRVGLVKPWRAPSWRPAPAGALAERAGDGRPTLAQSVRAAAALDCLNVALDHWLASDGHLDLVTLLDEAFAALGQRVTTA
ncbi:acyl-CoA-like ligand-binding transcription factor [Streptomyces gilvus]|uniref:acyl-CoA-like ligand-binding transcription factor n=1 Tax=Streptomyces gilvus TaxID=2920937 RepID=UPI001F0E00A6|nr:hypothetical protein [Streptomyces sp. CME 23]MCH5670432.1 hypothetical protein [Streptomyces sp. CME 23]